VKPVLLERIPTAIPATSSKWKEIGEILVQK
jgi:hypothetical protein